MGSYTFTCSGSNHGFLLAGSNFSTFDFPGSQSDEANGINNAGDIVGTYGTSGPFVENHGYLFSGGNFVTSDVPGAILTRAEGINNPPSKTIVRVYVDAGVRVTDTCSPEAPLLRLTFREPFPQSLRKSITRDRSLGTIKTAPGSFMASWQRRCRAEGAAQSHRISMAPPFRRAISFGLAAISR